MKKGLKGILLLILLLAARVLHAQPAANSVEAIRNSELQLRQLSDSIMKGSTDKVRQVKIRINPSVDRSFDTAGRESKGWLKVAG